MENSNKMKRKKKKENPKIASLLREDLYKMTLVLKHPSFWS